MSDQHDGSIVIDTGLDTEGFKQDSQKLLTAVERLIQKVDALGSGMQNSFSGLSGVLQGVVTAMDAQSNALSNAAQQSDVAAEAHGRVKAAASGMSAATRAATQEVKRLQSELAKVEKQLATADKNLAAYNAQVQSIHASTDAMLEQANTTEQVNTVLEIEKLEIDALNQKYANQIEVLKQLQAQKSGLQGQLGQAKQILQAQQLADAQSQLADETRRTQEEHENLKQTHTSAFKTMISNVRKYAQETKKATIDSNKLVRALTSIKSLLITRIKRMFISAIFSDVQSQLEALRQYYTTYDSAMTRIKAATARAGGNIAIAVANLVITAEPYIVRLINLLSTAIEKINKFFALLRGGKTVKVPGAIKDYTGAVNNATQAQKEFNAELYGFDELNRQSKVDKEKADSGVQKPTFEDQEVEGDSKFLSFIKDHLKGIATIAAGIGAAMLTWGIGNSILKAMGKNSLEAKGRLLGLAAGIGGATGYVLSFTDAWKNGLGNGNIIGMLTGASVAAIGLGVAFKSLAVGGITLAIGGFGALVVGAKEWIQTGELTTQAFKSIELGIAALGVGIAIATGSWIPLVIAAVAAGLLAIYNYWDEIKAFFANVWASIQILAQAIIAGIMEFWNQVVLTLQMAWQWVIDAFIAFITWCVELWNQFWAFVAQIWNSIKDAIVNAVMNAVQNAQAKWAEFKANTVNTFNAVKTHITTAISTAKASMVASINAAKNSAVTTWNAMLSACKSIFMGIHSNIVSFIQKAASYIASQSWYGYGVNLIQGFWNGLRSLMSAVWQSVVDFCRRCAAAVRSALRIHSPSRVFMELGEYTGLGFIEGIKNEEDAAIQTAENLANSVTGEMSNCVGGIDLSANGIQYIISSLSTIAGIFQAIAKTLGVIGNLPEPQISTGTVVPYKTKVDSGPSDAGMQDTSVVQLLMSVVSELQGLVQVVRGLSKNGDTVYKIIADGREIFDLVVDENNRAIQRTGQSPIRV